jgi:excisionase family DNA binding protein
MIPRTTAPATTLLLTAREAAAALAISERTLWGLTKAGQVRCVHVGRAVRYAPADLSAFIGSQKK